MPSDYLTMADIAKMTGSDATIGLIEDNMKVAPEARLFPARTIRGTSFKSLVRTTYPIPNFRAANEGTFTLKSIYTNRIHECFYLDGQMESDKAVATADELGKDHALALEADGVVRGSLLRIGSQIWYGIGTGGDPKGFPGAVAIVDPTMVVDATGTTAAVGSSVYLVALGDKNINLLFGNNVVFSTGDWRENTKIDATGKSMTVFQNSLEGWIGVEWLNPANTVVRIKKLTTDANKGLTDSLLADAMAKFPVGVRPTHIFMSRRSRLQLQKSRPVTLFGQSSTAPNLATIAPNPSDYDGVPIIATDALLDTEALTL